MFEIWRKIVSQHTLYMDASKLANVRQDKLKKNRLTSAEIEEIKRTAREPRNLEKRNPEDVKVRMENMAPEKIKGTLEEVRRGNQTTN